MLLRGCAGEEHHCKEAQSWSQCISSESLQVSRRPVPYMHVPQSSSVAIISLRIVGDAAGVPVSLCRAQLCLRTAAMPPMLSSQLFIRKLAQFCAQSFCETLTMWNTMHLSSVVQQVGQWCSRVKLLCRMLHGTLPLFVGSDIAEVTITITYEPVVWIIMQAWP